jgi:abhydrolase domain-containing protein 12
MSLPLSAPTRPLTLVNRESKGQFSLPTLVSFFLLSTSLHSKSPENDWDIPYSHSEALFNVFLEPLLPPTPSLPANAVSLSEEEWSTFNGQVAKRQAARDEIVTSVELHNFGTLHEFTESGRKIIFVQSLAGGHDYLGVQEGVQDVIGRTFGFFGR